MAIVATQTDYETAQKTFDIVMQQAEAKFNITGWQLNMLPAGLLDYLRNDGTKQIIDNVLKGKSNV